MFNLGIISKYRTQLMGFSTLLILICHAPASVNLPPSIAAVLSRGGWGVDIFLFLSGVGLWFSLSRLTSLRRWYTWRYTRLLVPYLAIYAPLTIVRALISGTSAISVIEDISTISFWTRHSSAWFVAVLIPLYFISPFIYKYFQTSRSDRNRIYRLLLVVSFCLFIGLFKLNSVREYSLVYNIQFALARIPIFVFGMFLGPYIAKEYKIKHTVFCCVLLCFCALLLKCLSPKMPMSIFFAIPTIILLCLVFSRENKYINNITNFMGGISLESYLFNGTLPFFIVNHPCVIGNIDIFANNYLPYIIVIAVGTMLSVIVNKMSKSVFDVLYHKY